MTAEHISSTVTSMGPALANHLWQSTLFVAVMGLLALLLRRNQARLRYSLWFAASVKFLVPFSLLIALGGALPSPRHVASGSQTALYAAIDVAGQPFAGVSASHAGSAVPAVSLLQRLTAELPLILAGIWLIGALAVLLAWYARWRQVSATLGRSLPSQHGREVTLLRRLEETDGKGERVFLRLSCELMEPGVFGAFRPVLVWPEGLSERLDDEQMEAILAHELCHLRRRDNVTAAIHMFVELLFWFHPMVWWMERRLVEERECACDEAVVELGSRPEAYAEGLLKACRFCVESPLACVSGITGADLSRRVRSIMTLRVVPQLGLREKLLLAIAAVAAIAWPMTLGVVRAAQTSSAQSSAAPGRTSASSTTPAYDVASIRPNISGSMGMSIDERDDSFSATNISIKMLLVNAYDVKEYLISGGPKWVDSARFDINAKVTDFDSKALKDLSDEQQQAMLQHLLADRFHLKVHMETKLLPVYDMVLMRSGPKFKEIAPDGENATFNGLSSGNMRMSSTQLMGHGIPLSSLANSLSYELNRTVVDKTGLTGKYDLSLTWAPADGPGNSPESSAASLFTALQEQLGLKLQPAKGPVETLVIDDVQEPSPN